MPTQRESSYGAVASSVRPTIEPLEVRVLLVFNNVLVNDPTQDQTRQDTQSETSLIAFGSTIIVGYNDSGADPDFGLQFQGWSRSVDGGNSFTDMGDLPRDTDLSDGAHGDFFDPVLARNTQNGTIYYATLSKPAGSPVLEGHVQIFRSANEGADFQLPVNATQGISRVGADKPWLTVDNSPGAGQGNVYLTFKNSDQSGSLPDGIFLRRSLDHGATWGPTAPIQVSAATDLARGPFVLVGPDHAVYLFWYQSQQILMRRSVTGGLTFEDPSVVANLSVPADINGDPGVGDFRANSFPHAAVNPVSGDLYVVYNDNPVGDDRANVFLKVSSDGGATWSAPSRLNDDLTTNDQWQPTIAVAQDGMNLMATFYDKRLDSTNPPNSKLIDRYAVIGAISGSTVTLRPNVRITTTSFPPVFGVDPVLFPSYMGDYDQVVAEGDTFYLTWGDNRDDYTGPPPRTGKQANVRFAKVPAALTMDGTTGADTITVQRIAGTPDELRILVNASTAFSGAYASVNKLIINGLDGNDTITLQDNSLGAVTVNGGGGVDTINVLGDSPTAEVLVSSGDGDDTLNVNTDNAGVSQVRFNDSETLFALNVGTGGGVLMSANGNRFLRTQGLSIAPAGFLDLADNDMIVDHSGFSPLLGIKALITSGYAGGAWTGNGIRTSQGNASNFALGYAENNGLPSGVAYTTFAGQTVDNTTVLVKFTFYGDADLNGNVNLPDFNRLAANFGLGSGAVWAQGDFNFDGAVNLADFDLMAGNFGGMGMGPGGGGGTGGYTLQELLEHLLNGGHGLPPR